MDRAVCAALPQPRFSHDNDNEPVSKPSVLKRWRPLLVAGGVAIAANVAALIGFYALPSALPPSVDDMRPANVQALEDGSRAILADDSRIIVAMSDEARTIILQAGEVTFNVAKDPARPFVVQAGAVYAQATGTVYSVRKLGQVAVAVEVAEGSVLVWLRDERDQAVLLQAGDKLTLDPKPIDAATPPSHGRPLPEPDIAKISLDNVSIAAAVKRFNKMNTTQIIVEDDAIKATIVVGHFKANDPLGFANAVAVLTGAEAVLADGEIVIKLK